MTYSMLSISETVFANSLDAFIPELWAQESLMILEANMIAANLVHRDFSPMIAMAGDVVNTRLPAEFTGIRKTDTDDVTVQDATATNVAVQLNQHLHTSFLIRDGEESKGFKLLRDEYLYPAMLSIAQMVDEIVLGEVYQFLGNCVGNLGTTPTKESVIAVREKMNVNQVPMQGRNLIVTASTEADLLAIDSFTSADKIGDEGTALREGSLGRKFGLNVFMAQNTPSIAVGNTTLAGAINNVGGYAVGIATIAVDSFTGAVSDGDYFTVAGDMTPQRVVSHVETLGNTTSIVFLPGLKNAVVDDAVVTAYPAGAINLVAGYANGYGKTLVIDGFTVAPKVGQLVAIGATPATDAVFSALSTPTTTALLLSRPLEAAAANNAIVAIGPPGNYNFAFHRNAVALVTRPLAAPAPGTGALSFVASYNGLSVRVTITYSGAQQGHLVTCDMLCGVKTLDSRLGAVLLA